MGRGAVSEVKAKRKKQKGSSLDSKRFLFPKTKKRSSPSFERFFPQKQVKKQVFT